MDTNKADDTVSYRLSIAVAALLVCAGCQSEPTAQAGMDAYTKDLIDAIAKLAGLIAVAGGLATVWLQLRRWREEQLKTHAEQQQTLALRREELRWRKASLARDVLGEVLRDEKATNAMRMLDWDGRRYDVDGVHVAIPTQAMLASLRVVNLNFTREEAFVRDCFEALFDHMQLIEHFLNTHLLECEDVKYPFSYYAPLMARRKAVFEAFLQTYGYTMAQSFLERFPDWSSAPLRMPADTRFIEAASPSGLEPAALDMPPGEV